MGKLIDADALKERIRRFLSIKSLDDLLPEEKAIVQHIDRMPPVDAVPVRHGYWVGGIYEAKCSVCGLNLLDIVSYTEDCSVYEYPKFCPNCGARMDGKDGGND